jgi:two-component system, NtrC family, response regulator AtoC
MVTVSPAMLAFFTLLKKVAVTEASILMRGETGTGKELAARAIHALSKRVNGPFNAVNCATFSSELMMSELFGHVRGAFTGATSDRKGVFELSNGGSLFLDEIAEIPIDVQARLLRVLQDRTFTPLGSTTPRISNVRLISATHVSLRSAVEDGHFREDLMYRIRVIPLFLPRLAERVGDTEMLAWRFIDEFNEAGYRNIRMMEAQARDALVAHSWPGNVRELRNAIEYASAIGDGEVLRVGDLPPEIRGERASTAKSQTLEDIERQRILEALEKANGRRGEAAARLGIDRSTLWRKIREYGIVPLRRVGRDH